MSNNIQDSIIKKCWERVLRVGFRAEMDLTQQMRLFVVNAFLLIAFVFTWLFVAVFVSLGSYSALQGLVIIPLVLLIYYLNSIGKFTAARIIVTYGLMMVVFALALSDRRTGTEFILIALGCCSVVVYDNVASILASFTFALGCYTAYVWIDAALPFVPDPTVSYLVTQNSLVFLSALGVVAQSLAFRSLINTYSKNLKNANDEINSINEELKSSNEQLHTLLEKLDVTVKEKSAELQAHIDTININLYSAATDSNGVILKVNKPLAHISGYSEEELIGKNLGILNSGLHSPSFFKELYSTIQSGRSWRGEIQNKAKNGYLFWVDMVIMPVKQWNDEVAYFLCLALPITDRKNAEEVHRKNSAIFESIAHETSHRVRGPMARVLGLLNLIESNGIKPEELGWIIERLKENIVDLDAATSDLTTTVNQHATRRGWN